MTSSGHVTSSGSCPIDRPWAHSYRLSIGTIPLSGFVSEIFSAKVATKISSNSDKKCRRRSILKNHYVTIMTSSGHVTSSGSCPIDRPWAHYYRLSIGTITLSGFVPEIFSAKFATRIITWWRHQWRHKTRMHYPWEHIDTPHTGTLC